MIRAMVWHRALAPLVVAVLLIGGASIASGQRPGMGPRPGGPPMGSEPGGSMRGPGAPPVALSFQWISFSQRAPLMRQRSRAFLGSLPSDLARKVGADNAIRLYKPP
jgi:hypothetical protein